MRLKKHRRAVLLSVNFLSVFGFALLSPLYALYVNELGGNAQTAALTWSFYTLLGGTLIILLGRVEDRVLRKARILTVGYIIQTAGTVVLFFANDISMLFAGFGVYALGTGLVIPAWKHMYTRAEDRNKEASQWGLFHGGNMLLISFAAAASSVIVVYWGYKGIIGAMVVAHLLAVLTSLKLRYAG